ncbi:hypothetical protein GIW32_19510 [Pseudomonas syringae]|nr:hypothetical protein [Pseudomonas syringae]MCF5241791.1 hypothetical protein [Pseudomonas syringae]
MKRGSECIGLPVMHTRAAGIDNGSRFHVIAVPADLAESPVQYHRGPACRSAVRT